MLELKNIHKNYSAGDTLVRALRGIDLQFRKNEFVSILGPSGCGKTTMLNIIGGLDQYTDGDLVIDGVSTKNYKDRDWDTYRNHSVGFVFQSYNLIPHQSVLANVELALTLSGVSRKERRERAKKVLEQVGLGDQLRKKPSEMSGGQMQRVAIARALVNNPDIILADEPTGALDTETSVQVMEILKEVAKERLVVMVTHNPDLAQTYSTRIIRMLDGKITDDSMPLTEEEKAQFQPAKQDKRKKARKPSMSLLTSFSLSLKNLITKKGRTILTSFAGSIGIIGIALIYAVSNGMSGFINDVQEDTLTSYPLTIEATTVDIGTLMQTFMGLGAEVGNTHGTDAIYSQSVLSDMFNALNNMDSMENDLHAFQAKIQEEMDDPESSFGQALSGVQYTYDMDLLVYTKAVDGKIIFSDTRQVLMDAVSKNFGADMTSMMTMGDQMSSSMGMSTMAQQGMKLWNEMLSAKDGALISPVVKNQYDVIAGRWPEKYNEIILVANQNYELDDLTLFALGLKSQEEINDIFNSVLNNTAIDINRESWSFEEIMAMDFRVILNSDCYVYDEELGQYSDLRETEAGLRYLYDNAIPLKVSGIIVPNEDSTSHMLMGAIGYTRELTEHIIDSVQDSPAISAQMENPNVDILTGLPFKDTGTMTDSEKNQKFRDHIASLDEGEKAKAYVQIMSIPAQEVLDGAVANALATTTREEIEQTMIAAIMQQMSVDVSEVERYVQEMDETELHELYSEMVIMQVRAQTAAQVQQQMAEVPPAQLAMMLDAAMEQYTEAQCAGFYDEVLEFSESTYEQNLTKLGYVRLDYPATVNLYASSFENKDIIEAFIADYNESVEELKQIHYTDFVGIMMSSVTTIIDAITYVLIAFVAISLVVSSIMIGVITLISVQERTKEIGILRAIGASKRNVSSMFNAETVIIGFASGLLGVGVTYLLCWPINAIIYALTDLGGLQAVLPVSVALILVGISVFLTLISGFIPSRSAAKKDPVVALRTE